MNVSATSSARAADHELGVTQIDVANGIEGQLKQALGRKRG